MLADSHFYFNKAADVLSLPDKVRTILLTPHRIVKVGLPLMLLFPCDLAALSNERK